MLASVRVQMVVLNACSSAHARAECVPKPSIATMSAHVRRVHVQVLKTAASRAFVHEHRLSYPDRIRVPSGLTNSSAGLPGVWSSRSVRP